MAERFFLKKNAEIIGTSRTSVQRRLNALPRSHQILKEAETAAESYQSPVQKLRENKENQKKELVAKISELSQKGMTVAEIAKTLNVPYSKVHYISRSKKEINQNLTYNVKKSHKNDRTRQDRQDSPAQELLQETLGLVSDRTDGAVLRVLKIESIRPFFMNPVKWCDPLKLKKYMCLWESGANFPPIEVVEQLPEQLKALMRVEPPSCLAKRWQNNSMSNGI